MTSRTRFRPARLRPLGLACLAGLCLGCARLPAPAAFPSASGTFETGVASWYGPGFQGRLTSNREVYDMESMTAAHRTLPFNTQVLVTNIENGLSTQVRINDRGPFVDGRIIDLSLAAARRLEIVDPGTAQVRLQILESPEAPPPSRFAVQAGSFQIQGNAAALAAQLGPHFPGIEILPGQGEGSAFYRVRIPARDRKDAERIAAGLASRGISALVLEIALRP
jgi:rare lipoprotein A